ncbi:hypothetical protein BRYFOR_09734 [Marvinbryantia formatexigens DSM 14469]|uniref:Uncharacterized protein n=1 Tax=Marvinbryantia formatexigens DSM 14469 TaxID=478749 RepID=C6LM35_9FIRM|nr:hypothetical protein BRYFOR_09734 [Marvinbryantia formatexigens DSM 14469]
MTGIRRHRLRALFKGRGIQGTLRSRPVERAAFLMRENAGIFCGERFSGCSRSVRKADVICF